VSRFVFAVPGWSVLVGLQIGEAPVLAQATTYVTLPTEISHLKHNGHLTDPSEDADSHSAKQKAPPPPAFYGAII
jgi:hypothetical protein